MSNYFVVPRREGGGFIYGLIFGNMHILKLAVYVSTLGKHVLHFYSWSTWVPTDMLFHLMYI